MAASDNLIYRVEPFAFGAVALLKDAKVIARQRRGLRVRMSPNFGNNPIKAKIQDAGQLSANTLFVLSDRYLVAGEGEGPAQRPWPASRHAQNGSHL